MGSNEDYDFLHSKRGPLNFPPYQGPFLPFSLCNSAHQTLSNQGIVCVITQRGPQLDTTFATFCKYQETEGVLGCNATNGYMSSFEGIYKYAFMLVSFAQKLTVVNLLTTSIECSDISMLTKTEKYSVI